MADGDKNKDVVFRRIRGRIVPIRVDRSRSSGSDSVRRKAKGVGLVASAFGAAAIGGAVQKKFQSKARQFRRKSSRLAALAGIARPKRAASLRKAQVRFKASSKGFIKAARRTRITTIGIAGTFLGEGLEQLLTTKKATTEERAVIDFTTSLAGPAIAAAFLLGRKKVKF